MRDSKADAGMLARWGALVGVAPAGLLVTACVAGPLLLVLRVSLYASANGRGFYQAGTVTVENFRRILSGDGLRLVGVTLASGVIIAAGVVCVAFPLVLFLRRPGPGARLIALTLIVFPRTAGLLAALFGLQRLLPRGWTAALLTEIYLVLPYAVLVLFAYLNRLSPEWEPAARGLGASRWSVFRRITLPLAMPGLLVAFQLGLMWGVGAFLGPMFLGTPRDTTLSIEIHRQAFEYGRWPYASALAVVLLALSGLSLLFSGTLVRVGPAAARTTKHRP